MANVMNALPKSARSGPARAALKEVRDAEDRTHAEKALDAFVKDYEAKWPKATEKVTKDREELLAFYAFPAEHWVHLKTTNPIESTFATVRLRTKVTKGPGSTRRGSPWPTSSSSRPSPAGGRSTPRTWSHSSGPV